MKSSEVRSLFLDYFSQREHEPLPSSALVPERDPTLFFTNAGMVQFKDIFTGAEPTTMRRATTSQKCLRVSGKHNDLENVGRTPRHHTFFEMLGNFSFGDYFKEDAIAYAWDLLTQGYGLDGDRLWVTIFEDDDEAFEIWTRKVGFPESRLQRLGAKDNFWSMGDTGPCGPCSEIHWDHGPAISSDTRGPAGEDPRYVEIWNLVFMQFDQAADGTRTPLPSPSIDTGMGLERIAAIKQGVYSNYDTDLFQNIIASTADQAKLSYGGTMSESDVALRVIADHARAAAFLVADGVMPSNEERGYVLRRIMRRAIRYGVKVGLKEPFLFRAADQVIEDMGHQFPELPERRDFLLEVIQGEEERFAETLDKGLHLLEDELEKGGKVLDGETVFKLYDTFGFPKDLTELIAAERGVGIDEAGYEQAMERQKELGRAAWKGSGDTRADAIETELAARLLPTDFHGYRTDEGQGRVLALIREGSSVDALESGDEGAILVDETPFYAESGGQVGDRGTISWEGGCFEVQDVQKARGGLFRHVGRVTEGRVASGDGVWLAVDGSRRDRTRLNHTATHLLHSALREVLGSHVQQKGSLVEPDRLRFDFSHHKPVQPGELQRIESLVYREILSNHAVETANKSLEQAKADGAIAMFGEKYGDEVRVVQVGDFSMELCGGTHASRSGDIGLFKITSESGVAAGVRRIEAVTGEGALRWVNGRDQAASEAAGRLRTTIPELPEALDRLLADRKRLERELEGLKRELARAAAGDMEQDAREVNGIRVLAAELPGDAGTLRDEADRLRDKLGSGLVVLGSRSGGSVLLVAAATKDLAGSRVHAGKLVGEVARLVGGGGGGRPDMAQAGGKDKDALPGALEKVYEIVAEMTAPS